MACKIPVIDLQAFPGELPKLVEACEEWGCFRIVNYEEMLLESLLQEMRNVAMPLFALPAGNKMRNLPDETPENGYWSPSATDPPFESYGLQDVEDSCSTLEETPIQRKVILDYTRAVNKLMIYIAHKIGEGLGVNGFSFEDWCCRSRINKYNFTPEFVASGAPLHTDPSFLTLLHDDKNIGGLQVMKRSGEFEDVDPCPGALVVNLGDIAPVWSNGRFLSVKHRVMCQRAGTRLTIASFLMGPKVGMVEAPPELVDSEHPRLFSPFTYQNYKTLRTLRKSKKNLPGEIVDCFRIENNKD